MNIIVDPTDKGTDRPDLPLIETNQSQTTILPYEGLQIGKKVTSEDMRSLQPRFRCELSPNLGGLEGGQKNIRRSTFAFNICNIAPCKDAPCWAENHHML